MIVETPAPQLDDQALLQCGIVQKNVNAFRIEFAGAIRRNLRVAEDGDDVEIVGPANLQRLEIVRRHGRIPIVKIKAVRIGAEMHPNRQKMRHPVGVGF